MCGLTVFRFNIEDDALVRRVGTDSVLKVVYLKNTWNVVRNAYNWKMYNAEIDL